MSGQATHCVGKTGTWRRVVTMLLSVRLPIVLEVLIIPLILAPDLSHFLSFEVSSLDEGEELKIIVLAQLNGFASILVTIRSFGHL